MFLVYFYCIRYFYCSMPPVSGSITGLMRYQGKGSSSICVAMLRVVIGIVGDIWLIYSCVDIGTLLGATFVDCPGFLFSFVSIGNFIGVTLIGLPVFLCYGVSIGTSCGANFGGLLGFFYVLTLGVGVWCLCCLVGYQFIICDKSWYGSISTSNRHPLFLLVGFFSAPLGIILNNSARFISAIWCVSLIFAKGEFRVGFCNAST